MVVCYPGGHELRFQEESDRPSKPVSQPRKRAASKPTSVPCALHLNSLRGVRTIVSRRILSFLHNEWLHRHPTGPARDFLSLPCLHPPCPQQRNSEDCGLFALEYLERLCRSPLPTLAQFAALAADERRAFLQDRRGWFAPEEVRGKRQAIAGILKDLQAQARAASPSLAQRGGGGGANPCNTRSCSEAAEHAAAAAASTAAKVPAALASVEAADAGGAAAAEAAGASEAPGR
jgi:hypothetical protein